MFTFVLALFIITLVILAFSAPFIGKSRQALKMRRIVSVVFRTIVWPNRKLLAFAAALALLMIVVNYATSDGTYTPGISVPADIRPAPAPEPKRDDDDYAAFATAKEFIEAQLKAPSTADFPWFDYKAYPLADGGWVVSSYVDAQNSFGAKLRSAWTCELKYSGHGRWNDSSNWSITGFCGVTE